MIGFRLRLIIEFICKIITVLFNYNRRLVRILVLLDDVVGLFILGYLFRVRGRGGIRCVVLQVAAEIFDYGSEDLDEDIQGRLGVFYGLSLAFLGVGLYFLGAADYLQQVVLLFQVLGDFFYVQIGDSLFLDQFGRVEGDAVFKCLRFDGGVSVLGYYFYRGFGWQGRGGFGCVVFYYFFFQSVIGGVCGDCGEERVKVVVGYFLERVKLVTWGGEKVIKFYFGECRFFLVLQLFMYKFRF